MTPPDLIEFAAVVKRMRDAQKHFFKTRGKVPKEQFLENLKASIELERAVDKMIEEILAE